MLCEKRRKKKRELEGEERRGGVMRCCLARILMSISWAKWSSIKWYKVLKWLLSNSFISIVLSWISATTRGAGVEMHLGSFWGGEPAKDPIDYDSDVDPLMLKLEIEQQNGMRERDLEVPWKSSRYLTYSRVRLLQESHQGQIMHGGMIFSTGISKSC